MTRCIQSLSSMRFMMDNGGEQEVGQIINANEQPALGIFCFDCC